MSGSGTRPSSRPSGILQGSERDNYSLATVRLTLKEHFFPFFFVLIFQHIKSPLISSPMLKHFGSVDGPKVLRCVLNRAGLFA